MQAYRKDTDGVLRGHGDGQDQPPEMRPGPFAQRLTMRPEKRLTSGGDAVDSEHSGVLRDVARYNSHRPDTPLFMCAKPHQPPNRSV